MPTDRPTSPPDDPAYEESRERAQRSAQQRLADGGEMRLGEDLTAAAIAVLDEAIARSPHRASHACRAGCGWCCHQPVYITTPEAITAVAHLVATWPAERITGLRSLLKQRINQRIAMGGNRAVLAKGLDCAFLDDDNACAIHPARPLACRGHLSSSAEACATRFADPGAAPPPIDAHAHHAARGVIHGLDAALRTAGLASGLRELHRAILELLPPAGPEARA
jgi:hypothetical protein